MRHSHAKHSAGYGKRHKLVQASGGYGMRPGHAWYSGGCALKLVHTWYSGGYDPKPGQFIIPDSRETLFRTPTTTR